MSGSHRATAYPSYDPSYEPMSEPVYAAQQQPYGVYEQPEHPAHQDPQQASYQDPYAQQGPYQPYDPFDEQGPYDRQDGRYEPQGHQGYQDQGHQDYQDRDYQGYQDYDAYDQPFQPYAPEPAYRPDPEPEPVLLAPATPAAAVPVEGRSRGHRRKPKKKRTGKAVTAGTALLLAAAAGWYTVGQDGGAKPGLAAADGPDPVAAPDQPAPQPSAPQPAADVHTEAPKADRGEARPDGSLPSIPGLGPAFLAKIPADTNQVVVASGQDRNTNKATVTLWTRTPEGRWTAGEAWQGHNAYKGWTTDHNEGDLRSPIGVFSLTDAGGRNADPGSKLPYDKDPLFVVSGTGFAGEQLAGSFDYVVAINYNRVAGNSPLDPRRPNGSKKGGGIWIHVDHGGPTHGCVSIPEDKMAELIRTLDPAAKPVIVMGDAPSLAA